MFYCGMTITASQIVHMTVENLNTSHLMNMYCTNYVINKGLVLLVMSIRIYQQLLPTRTYDLTY